MEPLKLGLVRRKMDARRLTCLMIDHDDLVVVEVRGRDATVTKLLLALCRRLDGFKIQPDQLELLLAKDHRNQWLLADSEENDDLVYGDTRRALRQYNSPDNYMFPTDLLHRQFPQQPPIYDGNARVIHVLVRLTDGVEELPLAEDCGATERLLSSLKKATTSFVDHLWTRSNGPRPMVVQSAHSSLGLWFGDTSGSNLFVSLSWSTLMREIFCWVTGAPVALRGGLSGRRAHVTGIPRSGKSVFLSYLLFVIVRSKLSFVRLCVVDVPGVTFALVDRKHNVVTEGTRAVDFKEELMDCETLYLFDTTGDAKPLAAVRVRAKVIALVPDKFHSMSTARTKTFAMPQWTMDDVQLCHRSCYAKQGYNFQVIVALWLKWGGLPGRIFLKHGEASRDELDAAIAQLSSATVVRALSLLKHTGSWEECALNEAWRPLMVSVAEKSFVHDGQVAFCSQYVCDRVIEKISLPTITVRRLMTPKMPALSEQVAKSLSYLAQEEEEKQSEETVDLRNSTRFLHRFAWD